MPLLGNLIRDVTLGSGTPLLEGRGGGGREESNENGTGAQAGLKYL